MAHDTERFPGGKMAGFMCWMSDRLNAWAGHAGLDRNSAAFSATMGADGPFDKWLSTNLTEST